MNDARMKYAFIRGNYQKDKSILVYARDETGKKVHIRVTGFDPHFYVERGKASVLTVGKNGVEMIKACPIQGIDGKILDAIVTSTPTDVKSLRDNFDYHYQADVKFILNLLVKTQVRSGFEVDKWLKEGSCHYTALRPIEFVINPVRMFVDIECYAKIRIPNPEHPIHRITCVTIWDNINKRYITFLLDSENKVETRAPDWIVAHVVREEDLIAYVDRYLHQVDPDVGVEWSGFDMEYMKARADKLDVKFDISRFCNVNLLRAYDELYKRASNRLKEVVWGEVQSLVQQIDLISKKTDEQSLAQIKRFRSAIDGFATEEFDVTKDIEPEADYEDLWDHKRESLLLRNKRHTTWIVKLNDLKKDIIGFFWGIKCYIGADEPKHAINKGPVVDTEILRRYNGKYILPSAIFAKKTRRPRAADVLEAPKGIISDVAAVDFSRYYVTILENLWSPETKNTRAKGIIQELARDLKAERNKYDDQLSKLQPGTEEHNIMKEKRDAVKYTTEALIGNFGSDKFRLCDVDLFEEVTGKARDGLHFIKGVAEDKGYAVIYGDTDGTFIKIPFDQMDNILKMLADALEGFCAEKGLPVKLKLKVDRFFDNVVFIGVKKKYFGHVIWEDGKKVDYILVHGFESIKRDSSFVTKKLQKTLFDFISRKVPAREIIKYVNQLYTNVKAGKYPLTDVALRKTLHHSFAEYHGLRKDGKPKTAPDYARGSEYAVKNLGLDIKPEDTIKMVYVKGIPGKERTNVVCFLDEETLPPLVINWDKMADRIIRKKAVKLLDLVGIKWEQVMMNREDTVMEVFG